MKKPGLTFGLESYGDSICSGLGSCLNSQSLLAEKNFWSCQCLLEKHMGLGRTGQENTGMDIKELWHFFTLLDRVFSLKQMTPMDMKTQLHMIHSVQQNNTNHLMTLQSTQASHAKDTDDLRGKYKMLQISINGSEREAFVMGSQLDGVQSEFYL